MEGRAGALSQIPHLMFAHSPTPFPQPLGYLLRPGRSPHLADQEDKDQQTKVDTDFIPFWLGREEARPPKHGEVEKAG